MRWSVKESIAPTSKINFDQHFQTPLCSAYAHCSFPHSSAVCIKHDIAFVFGSLLYDINGNGTSFHQHLSHLKSAQMRP